MVRVRRQTDERSNELVAPKTPQAKRDIALEPALAKVLREHRMASPFKADTDRGFPSSTGRVLNHRNLARRGFEIGLKNAELGHLRFPGLRHTYASC